jgi:hypothetical protein
MQDQEARSVEGPVVDEETGAQTYVVHGETRDVGFVVLPESSGGEPTWDVEIEGVPPPSIVHEDPWRSPEEAREAAVKAVNSILDLERMQREDQERSKPIEAAETDEDEPEALGR